MTDSRYKRLFRFQWDCWNQFTEKQIIINQMKINRHHRQDRLSPFMGKFQFCHHYNILTTCLSHFIKSGCHLKSYIDVGDGCWRPNVLVTRFRCWRQVTSPTSRVRHQHQISVTNITSWHIMMLVTDWNVTNMQKNVTNILK